MSTVDMQEDPPDEPIARVKLRLSDLSGVNTTLTVTVVTLEEESQWEVIEGFCELSWGILGKSCKEDN